MSEEGLEYKIAGINHMGWLLELKQNGVDIYDEVRQKALERTDDHHDKVRYEIMKQFGYYVTESSEHNAEYMPYFIKDKYPELIEKFNIPLDEYPRRCVEQIEKWNKLKEDLVHNTELTHERTHEYASYIMEAIVTNKPYKIGGNVLNTGLITNLPDDCCVEVPCPRGCVRRDAVLCGRTSPAACRIKQNQYQRAALHRGSRSHRQERAHLSCGNA